jgi:CRP-like cAMP-binding protein
MITPRTFRIPILGVPVKLSLMEVFGHLSFALLGVAYVTGDVVTLRCIAMGGMGAAVIFQYFRPVPLWLPLRWNLVFVGINAVWVAKLWWEERLARLEITEEERELQHRHFSQMPERDYWHLLHCGEWVDVPAGEALTREGEPPKRVYAVTRGSAAVEVRGHRLNVIHAGEFVGEMSFMKAIRSSARGGVGGGKVSSATVVAEEPMRCYSFDHDALLRRIEKDPGALVAVTAAFGASLVEKLAGTREHTHTLAVHSAREGVRHSNATLSLSTSST